ncbi:hypothetical protein OHC33_004586 [Knufia fluminis]|uniref:Sulfatase N-terminal domain-containing protein n=2 Tax=Knufia TaxID=430999 RepID=A0AAN8I9X0_9EURO|nr:hypothetical protein OHC33_004586 [Knufia fluminis]
MKVYATIVNEIDQNIQHVVSYLESTGELDNTFILFMSDNGAEGKLLEAIPMMGTVGNMKQIIERFYDNSFDNIGNHDSFVWYGPRWACAATAPSRGFKTWITEGGIRCPCVVRYPRFAPQQARNRISNSFTTVMDILPTVLDLAGASIPDPSKPFRGRSIVPVRGKSWAEHLESADPYATSVHGEDTHIHGWELFGLQAIRKGPWKAIYMPPPRGTNEWELYNLDRDPGEINNKATEEPQILEELIRHWEQYYAETGMIDINVGFGVTKG